MKTKINWELLLINILIPQLIGLLSIYFAGDVKEKYEALIKPPLAPPSFLFSIVWFVIFLLVGIAAYIISKPTNQDTAKAKFLYSAQLGINFLWNIIFFGLDKKLFAFFWILFLIIVLIYCFIEFKKINKFSAYLFIPYILWASFATYLNFGFWYLNR